MSCVIHVNNVTFCYQNGRQALSDLSFSVHQGEKVGVIGPSGAGKTTLFWHLNGLFKPSSGYVEVFGHPLTEIKNINEVRRRVALTFQQVNDQIFCSSVWEEIAFGPRNLGWKKQQVVDTVEKWLAYFGLEDVRLRPPQHLSGGEKRRVILAAAMAMGPDLLILDEPANDLDHYHRRRLITYLKELQIALMIATHDLYLIKESTGRCILMDNGKIIADRPTLELIHDEDLLKQHGMEAIER
ncbi:MAG: energy-coupling factor ABC transporter ATP-binding protein [Candidatus Loosdrechtia sp.]|uniref:energy-coupling factor ABC transporter ATP-binding protein n=1 Tax=Candidatus Loosdrechtia sp. TaxID=3101272 RepID=UPI003A6A589B|nr:MAG: ABC transporter ATP-binding protein [Candidatus Jettenia sp. AMX2]